MVWLYNAITTLLHHYVEYAMDILYSCRFLRPCSPYTPSLYLHYNGKGEIDSKAHFQDNIVMIIWTRRRGNIGKLIWNYFWTNSSSFSFGISEFE